MSSLQQEIVDLIPQLRRFAMALTRDRTAADDLVQDTLLRALDKSEKFQAGTNLRAWLMTIMRNLFISQIRRYGSRPTLHSLDGESVHGVTQPSQEYSLGLRELEANLTHLPEDQRTTLLLVGLQGLSYEEAAMVTGVAVGTVRSRLSRAREALRQLSALPETPTSGETTIEQINVSGK